MAQHNLEGLGLTSGQARVVAYDERWVLRFNEITALLRGVLGERVLAIEHVGSTSVPGLPAKPILDMVIAVPDFEKALELVPAIESLGFEFRPDEDIPDRHYFRMKMGEVRTHHLSLAEPGSDHFRKTIAFRDALRADPALARQYAELKYDLARRYPTDRPAYLDGKTDFVLNVLRSRGL